MSVRAVEVEVCLPKRHVLRRYVIPKADLVDREILEVWACNFMDIQEVRSQLIQFGHPSTHVTEQTLRNWESRLGLRLEPEPDAKGKKRYSETKTLYRPYEITQIDDLYRAKHLLGYSLAEYEELVLDKGLTLHKFLYPKQYAH